MVAETEAGLAIDPVTARRRRGGGAPSRGRASVAARRLLPYVPILPSLIAFIVLLGYPVVLVVLISLQRFGFAELVQRKTVWIGLGNYAQIFGDPTFWTVVIRTLLFTAANVGLTILIGTLMALLLERLGRGMRLLVSIGMILAWATPAVTGTVIFQWLFDSKLGVVNWTLTNIGIFGDFTNRSWFDTGFSTFAIITLQIVWQAVPFVAFSVYAGLLSIPREQFEAGRVDGGGEWQLFRRITVPTLRPLFMILIFLSIIWDFKVFTQVFAYRQGGPAGQTVTLSVYAYLQGISQSQFGRAAAVSVVMVALLVVVLVFYIRRMIREQEAL